MHLVVFGVAPGVSWGLLGATNSFQTTIQDARGGFWGGGDRREAAKMLVKSNTGSTRAPKCV